MAASWILINKPRKRRILNEIKALAIKTADRRGLFCDYGKIVGDGISATKKTAGALNLGSGKGGGFHTFEFENGYLLVKNALRMKFVRRSKKRLKR